MKLAGDAGEAARLRDLGIREGNVVAVLRDGDPLLVLVDEARIGLGRAAARNVLCAAVGAKIQYNSRTGSCFSTLQKEFS